MLPDPSLDLQAEHYTAVATDFQQSSVHVIVIASLLDKTLGSCTMVSCEMLRTAASSTSKVKLFRNNNLT